MSQKKQDERRRFERFDMKTNVWIEPVPGGSMLKLKTENVSAGGLLFETPLSLKVNGRIRLYVSLPDFLDLIHASCTVRHIHRVNGTYLIGVSMDDLEGITRSQLASYLTTLNEE